jgi:hypothetical protein
MPVVMIDLPPAERTNMSILETGSTDEALLPLHRMIVRLADRCGLDLGNSAVVRRFLDGDFSQCKAPDWDPHSCHDLHSMITVFFRIEASNSEDLGITGLHRLWNQQDEILNRFRIPETASNAVSLVTENCLQQ